MDENHDVATPPDVRLTYANERTFLAWNRTALALIASGLAATQFLPKFSEPYGRRLLGLPLIALGGYVAIGSYFQWRRNDEAMLHGLPLPRSRMAIVLAVSIGVIATLSAVLAVIGNR